MGGLFNTSLMRGISLGSVYIYPAPRMDIQRFTACQILGISLMAIISYVDASQWYFVRVPWDYAMAVLCSVATVAPLEHLTG